MRCYYNNNNYHRHSLHCLHYIHVRGQKEYEKRLRK
nr:MAG TPA: hypothetical protein [Caudoviricetes sp.]